MIKLWCGTFASAALCAELFPERKKHTIWQAEAVCENRFLFSEHWEMERTHEAVVFDEKINWAYIPGNDPEWLYAMNRHTSFVNLGKAWLYTGNKKYAVKLAELLEDWITNVKLTEESKKDTWRSLEAGLRCENWLRSLEMVKEAGVISPGLADKVTASVRQHGAYLAEASHEFHKLSNWGVLQDHGLFLAGLFFKNEEWTKLALKRLDKELHMQVMADGSHWEQSPMYHCEVLHCALDVVLTAEQNGVLLPERFYENTHRMCLALLGWVKPDGKLFCQSDSDDVDAGDLLAEGAILFADGRLKAAAGGRLSEENIWDFGPDAAARYDAVAKEPLKTASTALPDSGNYVLRGKNGAEAAYLHMHCGCLGSGHGHADLLHIDAGIYGEDVLIDSGRYTYVNTDLRRRLKEPAAHNTLRVDGQDFSECIDSWGYRKLAVPVKGEYRFTEYADYISGMHLGYFSLPDGVVTERRVIFIKPDIFVISDRFCAKGTHTYEQDFHFGRGSLTECGKGDYIWQGERAALRLIAVGADREARRYTFPYSREYNRLDEGEALTFSRAGEGTCIMLTALAFGAAKTALKPEISEIPVTLAASGKTLREDQARALRIAKDGKEYTVILVYEEIISEVDFFAAGTKEGYGKALVFVPELEDAVCLAW